MNYVQLAERPKPRQTDDHPDTNQETPAIHQMSGWKRHLRRLNQHGAFYILLTFLALGFGQNHFMGYSLGDSLLEGLGLSAWTKRDPIGLHITFFVTLALFVPGYVLSLRRNRSRSFRTWFHIAIISFLIVYPWLSEKAVFRVNYFSAGGKTVLYYQDESSCSFRHTADEQGQGTASCKLKLANTGREKLEVTLIPVISQALKDSPPLSPNQIQLEPQTVVLEPHSITNVNPSFHNRRPAPVLNLQMIHNVGLKIEVNGEQRIWEEH
ncbi:hypothetical protein Q5741_13675 [Paenibacillus sp. JX-17]|uniref:Uncharacterized protein n=1 Tax=Paenibacillus lacisoli TaxID=3064525 RepID=A0ABT9CE10_9BACL|nr:hypothetical protein [Paenibacillus sp. JX-17]MDO7907456.1 hypothetical protein [Paenibacillus sp. JX-17]